MEVDNASGAAPLNVTFTLNGTDPDGDALTWTLAFGDGSENETGSLLPAIFTHAFELEGNFTVVFEASDGNHTVNATAPVTVNAAVGAAKQTKIITGTTVLPNPAGDCCVCINDDVDGNRYALDPAEAGWLYTLEPGDGSFGVYWYNGGSYVSSSDPEGEVPEGVDVVEVCNLTGLPDTDYTMTLTEP